MRAFHNDGNLKGIILEEIENHRKQDRILQGSYGEIVDGQWHGCAVGCSIHSLNNKLKTNYSVSEHSVYETALGIPEWLARLEDRIFESLPIDEAKKWPGDFLAAIPVGANLEAVKGKFFSFLLSANMKRVVELKLPEKLKKQVVDAIRGALTLHQESTKDGAGSAAWSAAESAAESAARSAARSAWSAAWSAARSAAWSAARSAAYKQFADELLRLLRDSSPRGSASEEDFRCPS